MSKKPYEKETELNSIIRYNKTKEFSTFPQEKHYTSLLISGQKDKDSEQMGEIKRKHNNYCGLNK